MSLTILQDVFTKQLPKLQSIARFHFRKYPPELREEFIENSLGLTWKYFVALHRQGRSEEPAILRNCMRFSVRQTIQGRMVGKVCHKDPFDLRRTGQTQFVDLDLGNFVGKNTPVNEQAAFRIDVPAFFGTLTSRQRRMAADLASGESTGAVAKKFNVTPGAVSQYRVRFKRLYDAFFSE